MRERGLLGAARAILATVAGTAGLVPLAVLLGQHRPTVPLLIAEWTGTALTTVMAIYWSRRWPTRRQSFAAVLTGLICIAVWSQAQPDPAIAVSVCMAASITGGYIAFLHSDTMLAFNFAMAMVIAIATTLRLARQTDLADAAGSFWLILFINISVPLAIRALSHALWLYATRSSEDPLTGLLNRRAFTEKLLTQLGDRPIADDHLIVLLVDLDDFKKINDTHGHPTGDRLLMSVAKVLRDHITVGATICRAGGEEFLVAYTRVGPEPAIVPTGLCTAIAGLSPRITASIGLTSATLVDRSAPITADFVNGLIEVADRAMYSAKREGGNRARQEPSRRRPQA